MNKLLVLLYIFAMFLWLGLGSYYFLFIKKTSNPFISVVKKSIASLKTRNAIDWLEAENSVKSDCNEILLLESFKEHTGYISKLFESIGEDTYFDINQKKFISKPNRSHSILQYNKNENSIYANQACWAVWSGNLDDSGMVAYEDKTSKIKKVYVKNFFSC